MASRRPGGSEGGWVAFLSKGGLIGDDFPFKRKRSGQRVGFFQVGFGVRLSTQMWKTCLGNVSVRSWPWISMVVSMGEECKHKPSLTGQRVAEVFHLPAGWRITVQGWMHRRSSCGWRCLLPTRTVDSWSAGNLACAK